MTTAVIITTIVGWILLCAVFITASCVLSARLHQSSSITEDNNGMRWTGNDGEIPTPPLTR